MSQSILQKPMQKAEEDQFLLGDRLSMKEKQDLLSLRQKVTIFCEKFVGKPIVFLTSGGTSVPLEQKAVRFIENFSTGERGSKLAQEVLKLNLPLVYFYRQTSVLPFSKGINLNQMLLSEDQASQQLFNTACNNLKACKGHLLLLPFTSIYYYVNGILKIKQSLPQKAIIILCAAVSDFMPKDVSEHKIHTSQDLQLALTNTPKILGRMVSQNHLCISFKLETDSKKIQQRVKYAIQRYGVDMVIGNVLGNKNWISVNFNSKRFKTEKKEFTQKIEENIIKCALQANLAKFHTSIQ